METTNVSNQASFTKGEKYFLFGVVFVSAAIVVGNTIAQYKRHGELLWFKSKMEESEKKADAALKTTSYFEGQFKNFFGRKK